MSMTLELVTQRVEVLEKQMAMLLADKNVDVSDDKPKKAKKAKKEKKADSDDEKPKKKRISGYILSPMLRVMKSRMLLTVDGEKPKNPDVMRKLAKMWKALNEDEQSVWNGKAKEIKDAE